LCQIESSIGSFEFTYVMTDIQFKYTLLHTQVNVKIDGSIYKANLVSGKEEKVTDGPYTFYNVYLSVVDPDIVLNTTSCSLYVKLPDMMTIEENTVSIESKENIDDEILYSFNMEKTYLRKLMITKVHLKMVKYVDYNDIVELHHTAIQ
jgi:hypothetical protein